MQEMCKGNKFASEVKMATNESVRHQLDGTNTMRKYFAEIERMVFAAETYCADSHSIKTGDYCIGDIENCPFCKPSKACSLKDMRTIVGEP